MYHDFHKNIKQHNLFINNNNKPLIIRINVSWAPIQNIKMISEGSCDTEDWVMAAENSALHHRNKLHFKYIEIEKSYFKL